MNFKKLKKYIKSVKLSGVDTGLSSICYFSTSPMILGHHYFIKKFLNENYNIKYFIFYLKQIVSINKAFNIKILKQRKNYRFKKIYITWGFRKDFDKYGNIKDQYFKISSSKHDILWIVLYVDKYLPETISKNIILVSNLYPSKKFNIFSSIYYLIKIIFVKKFNLKKILHELSYTSLIAENIFKNISLSIDCQYVEKIFTPYEGQPFQHYIPQEFKKINNNIKFYGYVSHNLPHSFDMMNRDGSPDLLFLQSEDQKRYFKKNLNWENKKLKLISSLRFKKIKKEKLLNRIYFSNQLHNIKKIRVVFKNYLLSCEDKSLPFFKIITHPRGYDINSQRKLKIQLEKIIKDNKNKFSYRLKNNLSIVIGLTATPIYLLEHGIKVIHIVENSFFQSYDKKYWPSLNSRKLGEGIFEYYLPPNKRILSLKNKNSINFLKKLINN